MALIECPECKREISDRADSCPQCGYPIASTPIKPETALKPEPNQSQEFEPIPPIPEKRNVLAGLKEPFIHWDEASDTSSIEGMRIGSVTAPPGARKGPCPYCWKEVFISQDSPMNCPHCGRQIVKIEGRFYKYFSPDSEKPGPKIVEQTNFGMLGCAAFAWGAMSAGMAFVFGLIMTYSFVALFLMFMGFGVLITGLAGKKMSAGLKRSSLGMATTGGAMILAGFIVGNLVHPGNLTPEQAAKKREQDREHGRFQAYNYSQDRVKELLKAPASAKFPDFENRFVEMVGDDYKVQAYVDAQNGFGAMIRTSFTCNVHLMGDSQAKVMCSLTK